MTAPTDQAAVARFMAQAAASDSACCWQWTGHRNRDGYGTMTVGRRSNLPAHRFSYMLHVGPIPDGLMVLHTCGNRGCVNPGHLYLGTRADAARDRDARGRGWTPVMRGEQNGRARLTEAQVRAILGDHRPQRRIAAEYGVHQKTVHAIKTGKAWAHVVTAPTLRHAGAQGGGTAQGGSQGGSGPAARQGADTGAVQ